MPHVFSRPIEGTHRSTVRHRRLRRWWAPWSARCSCGIAKWPCIDAPAEDRPAARSTIVTASKGECSAGPLWNAPTDAFTPLLTRGQRWRGNGGRWERP